MIDKCIYCGSTNLIRNTRVGRSDTSKGTIGPQFKQTFGQGTEQVYADICQDCKSISRFFVERKDRKWITG